MPYKSRSQARFFFAAESRGELPQGTAREWAHHTPNLKGLPERVKKRKKRAELLKAAADLLSGGLADNKPDSAFPAAAIVKGEKEELKEHTSNPAVAKEIAKDHLVERTDYYEQLEKIEKAAAALLPAIMADQLRAQQQLQSLQQQRQPQAAGAAPPGQPTGGLGTGGPQGAANALGPPALSGKLGNGPGANMHAGASSGGYKVAAWPTPAISGPQVSPTFTASGMGQQAVGHSRTQAINNLQYGQPTSPGFASPQSPVTGVTAKLPNSLHRGPTELQPIAKPAALTKGGSCDGPKPMANVVRSKRHKSLRAAADGLFKKHSGEFPLGKPGEPPAPVAPSKPPAVKAAKSPLTTPVIKAAAARLLGLIS